MASYKVYGRRQTGVMAVEAALEEAGVDYEFLVAADLKTDEDRRSFGRINPRLQVPVLIHPDGTVITEGPAILVHVADAFPQSGLIPRPGTSQRALHDRWLAFFHANVYEGMLRELFPERYTTDAGTAGVAAAATDYVRRHFLIFEETLGQGPYLMGQTLTVFDIYIWMLCFWVDADWLANHCPRVHALWSAARSRPVLAQVGARHFD